ncbi:MAG TPA: hypothetical protein VFC78_05330 [Tepidisphaeraceae bacterium]|nr:hypothetical protein [Tepidisphaeraceae bacterium]
MDKPAIPSAPIFRKFRRETPSQKRARLPSILNMRPFPPFFAQRAVQIAEIADMPLLGFTHRLQMCCPQLAGPTQGKGENPKSETRNPKQVQNSNEENSKKMPPKRPLSFLLSPFEIVSDFVLRISDFPPLQGYHAVSGFFGKISR